MRSYLARTTGLAFALLVGIAPGLLRGQQRVGHLAAATVGIANLQDHGIGVSVRAAYVLATRFFALSIAPVDAGLFDRDDDVQSGSGAVPGDNDRCRDRDTGQPVDNNFCNVRIVFGASADVAGAVPLGRRVSAAVGGGYRIGSPAGAYALAAITAGSRTGRNWQLRGRFGGKLVDVAIGASIPFRCLSGEVWRQCP